MNFLPIIFLLFFASPEIDTDGNKHKQELTSVYHYHNNIMVRNYDGTRSSIYKSGNSATLYNPDGTHLTIDYYGSGTSNLISSDGTSLSILHHGLSSTIFNNNDGTNIMTNHMQSTSSCTTPNGSHTIMHTFGFSKEKRRKKQIDVLIHMNWYLQKQKADATEK